MFNTANPIFVFGSNLAGRHGKGAAIWARQHRGAIYGTGEGLQGQSYAIPTKDHKLRTLPLPAVTKSIMRFIDFANAHPHLVFEVTPIGCGLAGFKQSQIKPSFSTAPRNVLFTKDWLFG